MLKIIVQMIEKNINCPQTSSAGRLFDAVSALIGTCNVSTFHAEAPMRLEAAINSQSDESYDFVYNKTISVTPMIRQIVNDLQRSLPASYIAIKFHNTIVNIIYEVVTKLKSTFNINKVVLSGGFHAMMEVLHWDRSQ
jgi:hydrogenase maturation protein HypF